MHRHAGLLSFAGSNSLAVNMIIEGEFSRVYLNKMYKLIGIFSLFLRRFAAFNRKRNIPLVTKSLCSCFGAAFERGRHECFALWRLITNSRNSAFTGVF